MTKQLQAQFSQVGTEIGRRVLGQQGIVDRLLLALLADGHVLLQGPPGVAKTRAALLLSHAYNGSFGRIQFTPDLLPSDLTGTSIYDQAKMRFDFRRGPLFHDFVLADEINRAPAKVQAALLEAMAERQITAGGETHSLGDSFFVIATQNPIEEEGTYELPVAQLDRFAVRLCIDYPDADAESEMLDLVFRERAESGNKPAALAGLTKVARADLQAARQEVLGVHMSETIKSYIVRLVGATRKPLSVMPAVLTGNEVPISDNVVAHPVSPRGTLALAHLSCARAWFDGRDFVNPEDVQSVCHDVLSHRLVLSHRAIIQGVKPDDVIDSVVSSVPVS
ncbi:MAG: AAA family ATPase [Burkholderiaceae bacterium]